MLVLVFGATSFATATVLAIFMGGLAVGAYVGGRLIRKVSSPVLTYGYIEGAIGLWALLIPFLLATAEPLYRVIWQQFHLAIVPFSILRFLVTAFILLPPTTLMGATLPLLSRVVSDRLETVGGKVGTLYALNTLGAVIGTLLAGLLLLPNVGLSNTIYVAAALNLSLLITAVLSQKRIEQGGATTNQKLTEPSTENSSISRSTKLVLAAFAVSGAIAMVYEVAWTRTLLMVIGSTTYSFTIMLSAFLTGTFIGSWCCAKFVDKARRPILWFCVLQLVLGVTSAIAMYLFVRVPYWNLVLNSMGQFSESGSLLVRFALGGLILIPLSLALGALFPVVIRATVTDLASVGKSVGTAYAVNTCGAIVGAFLAGFVLLPLFGTERTLMYSTAANVLLGLVVLHLVSDLSLKKRLSVFAAVTVLIVPWLIQDDFWNKTLLLNAQPARRSYHSGVPFVPDSFESWARTITDSRESIFWKDGACSSVGVNLIKATKKKSLLTNGHIDASDDTDMAVQVLLGALPLMFQPDAANVAIVGWGSGVTAGTTTTFPVKKIKVIELEPAVVEASTYFHHVNHSPEADPRVKLELNDGRNFLLATDEKFDVIVSEPSNPWQSGVCNLFTKEYFAACSKRLEPGGVMSLWLQITEIAPENVRAILSSFKASFRDVVIVQANLGNVVVLGSNAPLKANWSRVNQFFHVPAIHLELSSIGISTPEMLLSRIAAASDGLDDLRSAVPNTDDRNALEFAVARSYENASYLADNENELKKHVGSIWNHLDLSEVPSSERLNIVASIARECVATGLLSQAATWIRHANSEGKRAPILRVSAMLALKNADVNQAEEYWQEALAIAPADGDTLLERGLNRLGRGEVEKARADFSKFLASEPQNKPARYLLARTYAPPAFGLSSTMSPQAISTNFKTNDPKRVLNLVEPLMSDKEFTANHKDVLFLCAEAKSQLGEFGAAEQLMRRYMQLTPSSSAGARFLGTVLYQMGERKEASRWWYAAFLLGQQQSAAMTDAAIELIAKGKQGEALYYLSLALELYPGNVQAQSTLAELAASNSQAATLRSKLGVQLK